MFSFYYWLCIWESRLLCKDVNLRLELLWQKQFDDWENGDFKLLLDYFELELFDSEVNAFPNSFKVY